KKWKSSNIISLALGQGEITMTPIQMAHMIAIIANKGYGYSPHLIKKDNNSYQKTTCKVSPHHFNIIHESMYNVIQYGTAKNSKISNINFCGKTGTSQSSQGDHSIFGGFAPYNDPVIAISVVIENGGFGSMYAAPIASIMIEKYIANSINKSDNYINKLINYSN
ncbi:MAG: penicillin-binding protein 2, partial [Bacteroides sp.]